MSRSVGSPGVDVGAALDDDFVRTARGDVGNVLEMSGVGRVSRVSGVSGVSGVGGAHLGRQIASAAPDPDSGRP
jgi:hypothetical protein